MASPQKNGEQFGKRIRVTEEEAVVAASGGNGKCVARKEGPQPSTSACLSRIISPLPTSQSSAISMRCSGSLSLPSPPSASSSLMPSSRSTSGHSAPYVKCKEDQKQYPVFSSTYALRFKWDHVPFLRVVPDVSSSLHMSPLLCQTPVPTPPINSSTSDSFVLYNEYCLLRELGKGTYARVVLCRSLRTGETCALKIFRGESRYADACIDEFGVLTALCRPPGQIPHDVCLFRDAASAECQGRLGRFIVPIAHLPHAAHHAIVLPVLGPSLLDVMRKITRGGARIRQAAREASLREQGTLDVEYTGLPMDLLRAVVFQMLLFLRHAHSRGIVHTDLKPENVLFETTDAMPVQLRVETRRFTRAKDARAASIPSLSPPLTSSTLSSTPSQTSCGTIIHEANVTVQLPVMNGIRVIDLGAGEFLNKCKYVSPLDNTTSVLFECIQTTHYRSPEVLLELGWNTSADIWSLGCMIPEMLTGSCVFMPKENIEHLALIQHIIGPFGASGEECSDKSIVSRVFARGRSFSRYFGPDTLQLLWPPPHLSGTAGESEDGNSKPRRREATAEDMRYVLAQPTLNEILGPYPTLLDLCRRMLDYDPLRRITAEDALRHPFFTTSKYVNPAT